MQKYIYEELTLAELSERFLGNNNFQTPDIYPMDDLEIEVETSDKDGNVIYKPITSFVVKESVDEYFTDGLLKGTANHRIVETGKEIYLKDHPEFVKEIGKMFVVDIEVADEHTYLANGRLNHNTTSGGKALAFHASVRIRLKSLGQIKVKMKSGDEIVGIKTRAQVVKNRLGPPLRTVDYDIYFNSGIDDYGSWIDTLESHKLIIKSGNGYHLTFPKMEIVNPKTGELASIDELKFYSKDFASLLIHNKPLQDYLYDILCNALIMKYKVNEDFGVDDITVSNEDFISEEG